MTTDVIIDADMKEAAVKWCLRHCKSPVDYGPITQLPYRKSSRLYYDLVYKNIKFMFEDADEALLFKSSL